MAGSQILYLNTILWLDTMIFATLTRNTKKKKKLYIYINKLSIPDRSQPF
jgi:hypothetical protein